MTRLVKIVDPPSGWMYGFPKPYTCEHSGDPEKYEQERNDWFIAEGYPEELIAQGMLKRSRSWFKPVEENDA